MLDSKNVTEKDQKVKFLQAIIACTTLVYGKEITVKGNRFQCLEFYGAFKINLSYCHFEIVNTLNLLVITVQNAEKPVQ